MSRGRKIALGLGIVVVLAGTIGCTKFLNYFREKHPDPPPGAFPQQVGKMVIDLNERWGKNPNCTRADPLHCWGYYVLPGGDDELTRIDYYMQIFDSPDEANARQLAYAGERGFKPEEEDISWEDRLNKEGEKIGTLLIKNSVHRDGEQILGFCSVSYTKDVRFIRISHGYECDPAREFLKDLTAITE